MDNFDPSVDQVRQWGYDEDMHFMEQDEDLILHNAKYVAVLMELASDAACPRKLECLSILTHFSRALLAARSLEEIERINQQINEYQGPMAVPVENWKTGFLRLRGLIVHPHPLTSEEAAEIAFKLTVGPFCSRDFNKLGTLVSGFEEYVASSGSYQEYFYINPHTSSWRSSRHFRLHDGDVG